MKPIGGFFELELPVGNEMYHSKAIALSTGRACLRLMLQNMDIRKCYVPFYTCDALYDPFLLEKIEIETYGLTNQLEPEFLPELNENEFFLYINYFGIKSKTVEELLNRYGKNLIVDNTHLFFHQGYHNNWSFTSARKYYGVPDGAFLYAPIKIDTSKIERFKGASIKHNVLRMLGLQNEAHHEYTEYEKSLTAEVHLMSIVSEKLLSLVDYDKVKEARLDNFKFLHELLGPLNQLHIDKEMTDVPFAYPFLPKNLIDKKIFYKHNLFIPSLWLDPYKRQGKGYDFDKDLSVKLMPVPIDHRYNRQDMLPIADLLIANN